MTSRSKQLGTRAESRVVRYLKERGFKDADRLALHGNKDIGDVTTGTPYNIEVKAGRQARDVFRSRFERWAGEALTETCNLPDDKECVLCIVEQGRALRDAKVFMLSGEGCNEGCYRFFYFDQWVEWLAARYLDE